MPGTMHDVVRVSSARERMMAILIGVFATMATIIAAVGVFGVVSFTVTRRAREFAIRNALGATRRTMLLDVLRSNAIIASTGALAGAFAAWSAAPSLRGFLYNVAPRDALVFTGVPAALVVDGAAVVTAAGTARDAQFSGPCVERCRLMLTTLGWNSGSLGE